MGGQCLKSEDAAAGAAVFPQPWAGPQPQVQSAGDTETETETQPASQPASQA